MGTGRCDGIMEEEYHILFPKLQVNFSQRNLYFLINKIKSRLTSVLYFKLHCYDSSNQEIYTYVSPRWAIDTEYRTRKRQFDLSEDVYNQVAYTQIELITIGITSENPLYFTECMLSEYGATDMDYHLPNEAFKEVKIRFLNSRYINLYDGDGNFLQIIRPNGEKITTNTIAKSTCTVLAPHLSDESDIDDPTNVFLEFINQKEQTIDVLR